MFSINVNINVGITPELAALAAALIQNRKPEAVQDAPSNEQQTGKRGRKPKQDAPEPSPEPEPTPEPEPEPSPEEAPAQEKELTEADIREAMHRTRQRIEGENYKDETESPNYVRYHRQLNGWFKNIAQSLGFDKPSAINTQEGRASFISQVAELTTDEKGEITINAPF